MGFPKICTRFTGAIKPGALLSDAAEAFAPTAVRVPLTTNDTPVLMLSVITTWCQANGGSGNGAACRTAWGGASRVQLVAVRLKPARGSSAGWKKAHTPRIGLYASST